MGLKVHVYYHDKCFDGASSAAIFSRFYRERIRDDVEFVFSGLLHRAAAVVGDGPELARRLAYLGKSTLARSHFVAALTAYLAAGLCVGFQKSGLICGLSAALYATGLAVVYLGTSSDFTWHVDTSLDRVLLTPTLLLLCGLSIMIPDIIVACRGLPPGAETT